VFAVAHTHWDREWYHPAARFQARLIALVDALLARDESAPPFLLDGQAIVLADYLQVRPERAADVRRLLSRGAIETGPWFVLADNLIPSGEAIIRNLEAGRRWLLRLGGTAPPVAYCPDTFGHPAALPTIVQGFGCATAIVWRGFGGASFPPVDTVWWHGGDGSAVLLHHLPPDGYEFGSALPLDREGMIARWTRIAATLRSRNETGAVMLPIGADHHAAPDTLAQSLSMLHDVASGDGAALRVVSLSQLSVGLHESVAAHANAHANALPSARDDTPREIPIVHGELRDSYGYTWTLQGTWATRAYQKRSNAKLERALLTDVEPWTALAWLQGASSAVRLDGALGLAQVPTLLDYAWEMLLATHPHDTLCGCSIDPVAQSMTAQQARVRTLVAELRAVALAASLGHDVVQARSRVINAAPSLVIRNRTAQRRSGIAELRVIATIGDVTVGPASAVVAQPTESTRAREPRVADLVTQVLASRVRHLRRESPQHYPDDDLVREFHVLAWVPPVPPLGLRVFAPDERTSMPAPPEVHVRELPDGVELQNSALTVRVTRAGVTVQHGERVVRHALAVETRRDDGDSYTPALRGPSDQLELHGVRVGTRGPLRASAVLSWRWRSGREYVRVVTELILDADASHLRCDIRGWNGRRNHRLQLVWQHDVQASRIMADAALGPVQRTVPPVSPVGDHVERASSTMPLHRWIAVSDNVRGIALLSDGLAEGEVQDGRLAVTLVRAIGALSKADIEERPGHAGWPAPIPAAQCMGAFHARVGLLLHEPWTDRVREQVDEACDAMLTPLCGESWRDLENQTSRIVSGASLEGVGLRTSSVHLAPDGHGVVLRCVNTIDAAISGAWVLPDAAPRVARQIRLDGTPLDDWCPVQDRVEFAAPPRAVITFEIRSAG
jgi:hypothetical protein